MTKHQQQQPLYISLEQQEPLEALLEQFSNNPEGLMLHLASRELLEDFDKDPLRDMNLHDVMRAYYAGYEVQCTPEQTVAKTLKRWKEEYSAIGDDYDAFFLNTQELQGKIKGARYVLETLGIKLPQ